MASIMGSKAYRVGKKVAIGAAVAGTAAVAAAPQDEVGDWRLGARYALGTAALGGASKLLKRHAFKNLIPAMRRARRAHMKNVRRYDLTVKGGLGIPGGQVLPALPEGAYLRTFARDAAIGSADRLAMAKSAAYNAVSWKGKLALGAAALGTAGAVHLGVRAHAYNKRKKALYARKGL
jgi:hypothetical protein